MDFVAEKNIETRDIDLNVGALRACVAKPEVLRAGRWSFSG